MMQFSRLLSLFLVSALAVASGASRQTAHEVSCGGARYQYQLLAPVNAEAPQAAIMVLHGAGDHAENFVEAWKPFARREEVVIIAPELPRKAEFEEAAPAVFRCLIDDAKHQTLLDPARLYLFGHSMGGYLAYDAAMFDSDLFAAVAVHAMHIAEDYAGIVKRARRKTPIAIFIGDRDPLVPLAGVRRTRDLLEREGFPVQYQELKGHDHNYGSMAEQINADAWKFFQKYKL
jgi:poly(3-hydroxybutyrate) depolymerase